METNGNHQSTRKGESRQHEEDAKPESANDSAGNPTLTPPTTTNSELNTAIKTCTLSALVKTAITTICGCGYAPKFFCNGKELEISGIRPSEEKPRHAGDDDDIAMRVRAMSGGKQ